MMRPEWKWGLNWLIYYLHELSEVVARKEPHCYGQNLMDSPLWQTCGGKNMTKLPSPHALNERTEKQDAY